MKYDEQSAKAGLAKKRVFVDAATIDVSRASDLGNSSWGKIDFLVKHKGYHLTGMSEYKKQFNSEEHVANNSNSSVKSEPLNDTK